MLMQNNDSIPNQSTLSNGAPEKKDNNNGIPELGAQSYEDRNGQHHPIAEFLYQLTKMLTDDNNEIIEWADGRIKVHHPERLEGEVLHKYFRHSKFASFQRQLNYFGFRKIAGKGKMSPCSYVNESATSDIRSLLLIKRKTNGSAARKAALQQRAAALVNQGTVGNPGLAGINLAALGGNQVFNSNLQQAMALLSENALRAGVGQIPMVGNNGLVLQQQQPQQQQNQAATTAQLNLLALQHQRLQKQLLEQQSLQDQLDQNKESGGPKVSFANNLVQAEAVPAAPASNNIFPSPGNSAPSLDQLHAHLKALGQQAQHNSAAAQMNNAGNIQNFAAMFGNNSGANPAFNRATAALNAQMPATAAMDAAAPAPNNLFESAANLKSLLDEHKAAEQQSQGGAAAAAAAVAQNPSQFFSRFPSNGQLATNMSTLSFGNLLGSSNRLSSLLSLNSFLGSREASLADFAAAMPQNVREQLGAAAAANQLQDAATKFRPNNSGN